ncbi:MAG TPA: hypothetical protein VG733_03360 [Chthoniobacteraceae bacterium]|nr:hypothetical protein [Chthoniobacteraceae bacterium]
MLIAAAALNLFYLSGCAGDRPTSTTTTTTEETTVQRPVEQQTTTTETVPQ